jgi:hypothetical protein
MVSLRPWLAVVPLLSACLIDDNPAFHLATDSNPAITPTTATTTTGPPPASTTADESTVTTDVATTVDLATTTTATTTTTTAPDPTTTGDPDTTVDTTVDTTDDATDGCPGLDDPMCKSVPAGGHEYLLCFTGVPWLAARQACELQCARLAVFTADEPGDSANDQSDVVLGALLSNLTREDTTEMDKLDGDLEAQAGSPLASWWIGGARRPDGVWEWVDGTPMPLLGADGWQKDQPPADDSLNPQAAALAVYGAGMFDGEWFARDTGKLYRYVCERL